MINIVKSTTLSIISFVTLALAGCSGGDISGKYAREMNGEIREIELTSNGKLLHKTSGDMHDYEVDGNRIIISHPFGQGAVGQIDGNKLVFDDKVFRFGGTWTKQ